MISSKGRYALRMMTDLAQQNTDTSIPLKDIAERQHISRKYLEAIAKELVNASLLKAASGKRGGYRLTRNPDEYSVGEILGVTENSLAIVACLDNGADSCPLRDDCDTLPMWSELNEIIHNYLYSKKLSDII